ncbi:hypothetical protein LG634_26935 [Streptomyces bambusae]|uniref:hypothetical protein n=1 Tax=Streptomyces bambusae TaxID=1550616 RepID=UPI001CFD4CA4|nr:hypothetical protein [Streptomyces bambusae]MCB5168445.1 hypothetical protein [Streptomyces bambusae]
MERRTPQDKKRLSYLKDRRNAYGENDKASRRNIPRSRRARRHALRRAEQPALHQVTAFGGSWDESEVRFARPGTGRWRKWPDGRLAESVVRRLERRAEQGGAEGAQAEERIRRVRRSAGLR